MFNGLVITILVKARKSQGAKMKTITYKITALTYEEQKETVFTKTVQEGVDIKLKVGDKYYGATITKITEEKPFIKVS